MTLRVYVTHWLVISTFWQFRVHTLGSVFVFSVAVYTLALCRTVALNGMPIARFLVTKNPEGARTAGVQAWGTWGGLGPAGNGWTKRTELTLAIRDRLLMNQATGSRAPWHQSSLK